MRVLLESDTCEIKKYILSFLIGRNTKQVIYVLNSSIVINMNNKIALVNRDLHNKLFETQDQNGDQSSQKIYRRHPLPPQIMLKNMIKKGLTNTQSNFLARPKTANSTFIQQNHPRNSMSQLRSGEVSQLRKGLSVKKNGSETESHSDYNMNIEYPQQFEQFGVILNKIKYDKQQQGVRKRAKLQKYGQRKFNYGWKKYNIPS